MLINRKHKKIKPVHMVIGVVALSIALFFAYKKGLLAKFTALFKKKAVTA